MKLDRITIEPGKMGGRASIRGMRITVSFVLKMVASGMSREQILTEHSDLERADIDQCLEYAAAIAEEQNFSPPLVSA
jgi:uncharacterized protein (DUF433 family)